MCIFFVYTNPVKNPIIMYFLRVFNCKKQAIIVKNATAPEKTTALSCFSGNTPWNFANTESKNSNNEINNQD